MSPTSARSVSASTGPMPDQAVERHGNRIGRGALATSRVGRLRVRVDRRTAARGADSCAVGLGRQLHLRQPREPARRSTAARRGGSPASLRSSSARIICASRVRSRTS